MAEKQVGASKKKTILRQQCEKCSPEEGRQHNVGKDLPVVEEFGPHSIN